MTPFILVSKLNQAYPVGLCKSSIFSGNTVPFVSGKGITSRASTVANIDKISRGNKGVTSCSAITSGASIEPILENITAAPTPALRTMVG